MVELFGQINEDKMKQKNISNSIFIATILIVGAISAACKPIAVDVSSNATSLKTYRNDKYGFELTFTDSWKGYKVEEATVGVSQNVVNILFEIPIPYSSNKFEKPYPWQAPFYIQIFKTKDWPEFQQQWKKENSPEPKIIDQNSEYVFTLRQDELPEDLKYLESEIPKIISTFKFVNKQITNFKECAAAGYPVGESYPRQCFAPQKTFFEELKTVSDGLTTKIDTGKGVLMLSYKDDKATLEGELFRGTPCVNWDFKIITTKDLPISQVNIDIENLGKGQICIQVVAEPQKIKEQILQVSASTNYNINFEGKKIFSGKVGEQQ